MNVALPPDLEQFVKDKVAEGAYPTEGEVVREALRRLAALEQLEAVRLEQLRKDVEAAAAQLDRGEGVPFDAEEIMRAGRALLARKRAEG